MSNPADSTGPEDLTEPATGPETDRGRIVEPGLGFDDDGVDQPPLGPVDAEPADVDPATPAHDPLLEMRQVAGLTAGSVTELDIGSFQFHESESEVGFAVRVNGPHQVIVVPGTAVAHVDEIPLSEPAPLHHSVLNVGSACFTVRRPRPEPSPNHRMAALDEARRPQGAIPVPDLRTGPDEPTQTSSTRFGPLFSRSDDAEALGFDPAWWAFLDTIREIRTQVAERHRLLHPDPEELRSRLRRLDPGLWDRPRHHPLFGRVALAYATIPWQPRFDDPDRIPPELHDPIREMSQLPWVPVTANLSQGPLGIVGSRQAVLAAARNAVLSLACLSAPSDIVFSIVTAKGLIEDWSWTTALPNSLFPNGRDAFPIAVADGMVHFEGAGFEHEAVLRNEMGLIALAERIDELPEYCGTILQIAADGRCQVSNHLGEQVPGTPIGVTAGFASALAAAIAQAVGDDEWDQIAPDVDTTPGRPGLTGGDTAMPGAPTTEAGAEMGVEMGVEVGADPVETAPIGTEAPDAASSVRADQTGDQTADADGTDDGEAETDLAPDEVETKVTADDFADELGELFGPQTNGN